MKAEIKNIYSSDIEDLKNYTQESNKFGFPIRLIVGEKGKEGEESFDIFICSPDWLKEELKNKGIIIGRHYLFVNSFNYDKLVQYLSSYINDINEENWVLVGEKIGRIGFWEFEDYKE